MPLAIILVGAVVLVSALRNTQGDLAAALAADMPGFATWFAAVLSIGAVGWIPGMQTFSRWLLILVLLVLVLRNYSRIFAGFASIGGAAGTTTGSNPTPAQSYAVNPSSPNITQAQIIGFSGGSTTATASTGTTTSPFDPAHYLAGFAALAEGMA